MLKQSYWNHKGKYQKAVEQLNEMIPAEGTVPGSNNRALNKLIKASNCYHDLYNNGLCNRASEFRQVFGLKSSHYTIPGARCRRFVSELYVHVEQKMDEIVAVAAREQAAKGYKVLLLG